MAKKKKERADGFVEISLEEVLANLVGTAADTILTIEQIDPNDWYGAHAVALANLKVAVEMAGRALMQSHAALNEIGAIIPARLAVTRLAAVQVYEDASGALTIGALMPGLDALLGSERGGDEEEDTTKSPF